MPNSYFKFKQFTIHQDRCAMKVTTDSCLFGAWIAKQIAIDELGQELASNKRILDVGSGTGLLALMIAQQSNALIDTIEIDDNAFSQAIENVNASPWANQINVLHGDAKEFDFTNKYDWIISNPPFYDANLKSPNSAKNIAHHDDGLSLNDLLTIIKNNLAPGGCFSFLLPAKRLEEAKTLSLKYNFNITTQIVINQSNKHSTFRIILKGMLDRSAHHEQEEITIKIGNDEYTHSFKFLLKDYYLNL